MIGVGALGLLREPPFGSFELPRLCAALTRFHANPRGDFAAPPRLFLGPPTERPGRRKFRGEPPELRRGRLEVSRAPPDECLATLYPSLGRFATSWSLPPYVSRGALRTPGRRCGLRATLWHRARPLSLRLEPPGLFAVPLSPLVEPPEAFAAPPCPPLEPLPFATTAALPARRAALRRRGASHAIPSSAPREPRAARRVSRAAPPVPCAAPSIPRDALASRSASRRPPGSLLRRPGGSPRARSAARLESSGACFTPGDIGSP